MFRSILSVLGLVLALAANPANSAERPPATLYKNPQCGCCEQYANYLRRNGFTVKVVPTHNLSLIRRQAGVNIPEKLGGCDTMFMDKYVVEGHVPLKTLDKLMTERPATANDRVAVGMSPAPEAATPRMRSMARISPGVRSGTASASRILASASSNLLARTSSCAACNGVAISGRNTMSGTEPVCANGVPTPATASTAISSRRKASAPQKGRTGCKAGIVSRSRIGATLRRLARHEAGHSTRTVSCRAAWPRSAAA